MGVVDVKVVVVVVVVVVMMVDGEMIIVYSP